LTGVLLALSASLIWGFADFGAGVGARRLPVFVVGAITQGAGLVLAGIVVIAVGRAVPSSTQLAWAAFAGLVGVIGLSAFYRALAVGTMGVVGPITATASVVPLAYGLARGERPSTLQGIGVGLALLGVALSFGGALIGLSRAASGGVAWATLTMRIVALPLMVAAAFAFRSGAASWPRGWLLLVGVGIGDTGATMLYAIASTRGLLSIVAVLSSLYPIVIVTLARVLLKERIAPPQLAGVAVALAGVALVSTG
jgi:drug/metabolite transporter (DMT)-like permease